MRNRAFVLPEMPVCRVPNRFEWSCRVSGLLCIKRKIKFVHTNHEEHNPFLYYLWKYDGMELTRFYGVYFFF